MSTTATLTLHKTLLSDNSIKMSENTNEEIQTRTVFILSDGQSCKSEDPQSPVMQLS